MLNPVIPQIMELLAVSVLQMELEVYCSHFTATNDTISMGFHGSKRLDVFFCVRTDGEIVLMTQMFQKMEDRKSYNSPEEAVTGFVLWMMENHSKG